MSNMVYTLPSGGMTLAHGIYRTLALRDGYDHDKLELEAHIRSGDYFAMLATTLDAISQNLATADKSDSIVLERMVKNLLYLQKNYEVRKKTPAKSRR